MSYINIHFRLSDGEIVGWGNADVEAAPGVVIAGIDVPEGQHIVPDRDTQKIDLKTRMIVDKTPEEQALARAPNAFEMKMAIAQELAATDQFVMPHRPMAADERAAWTTYQQALRDLSKQGMTPIEMMNAWPMHPKGYDPLHLMRQGKHARFR